MGAPFAQVMYASDVEDSGDNTIKTTEALNKFVETHVKKVFPGFDDKNNFDVWLKNANADIIVKAVQEWHATKAEREDAWKAINAEEAKKQDAYTKAKEWLEAMNTMLTAKSVTKNATLGDKKAAVVECLVKTYLTDPTEKGNNEFMKDQTAAWEAIKRATAKSQEKGEDKVLLTVENIEQHKKTLAGLQGVADFGLTLVTDTDKNKRLNTLKNNVQLANQSLDKMLPKAYHAAAEKAAEHLLETARDTDTMKKQGVTIEDEDVTIEKEKDEQEQEGADEQPLLAERNLKITKVTGSKDLDKAKTLNDALWECRSKYFTAYLEASAAVLKVEDNINKAELIKKIKAAQGELLTIENVCDAWLHDKQNIEVLKSLADESLFGVNKDGVNGKGVKKIVDSYPKPSNGKYEKPKDEVEFLTAQSHNAFIKKVDPWTSAEKEMPEDLKLLEDADKAIAKQYSNLDPLRQRNSKSMWWPGNWSTPVQVGATIGALTLSTGIAYSIYQYIQYRNANAKVISGEQAKMVQDAISALTEAKETMNDVTYESTKEDILSSHQFSDDERNAIVQAVEGAENGVSAVQPTAA